MRSREISKRFEELNKNNNIICTQAELDSFLNSGIVIRAGESNYLTMSGQMVKIDVVKDKAQRMTLDFGGLLSQSVLLSSKHNDKKIYFMSEVCYKDYDEQGLIVHNGENDYYRLFDKELWLICKMQ